MQKAGAMLETIIVKEMLQIQGTPGQIKQVAKGHKKIKASPKTPKGTIWATKTVKRGPYGDMDDEKFCGPSTIWATKRKNAAHIIVWATKFFVAHTRSLNVAFFFDAQSLGFECRTSKIFSPPIV